MSYEDLGRAMVEPAGTFPVGDSGTWKIVYTVGSYGMDDGGSILIVQRDMTDAGPLQCESPNGVGYVTALTTGDARLKISFDPWRWVRPWRGALVVGVCDGSLAPGERIEVILGDTGSGSPGWVLQTFLHT